MYWRIFVDTSTLPHPHPKPKTNIKFFSDIPDRKLSRTSDLTIELKLQMLIQSFESW